MPIFISYNHRDLNFVENLAKNLVAARHNVWIDRCELNLGDSLTQKIQEALKDSSAILIVLSKNSVESEWCKRELSPGLIRELEERKTLVMPCIIDDCEVPLFLRDKLCADFRRDPNEALDLVDRSLSRISNPLQGRSESPKFHTDWGVDWIESGDGWLIRWVFVDHGHNWPYVILSQCTIICEGEAGQAFGRAVAHEEEGAFLGELLSQLAAEFDEQPLSEEIDSPFEKFVQWNITDKSNRKFTIYYAYRRLGEDNGMNTLVHLDNNIRMALKYARDVTFKPRAKRH